MCHAKIRPQGADKQSPSLPSTYPVFLLVIKKYPMMIGMGPVIESREFVGEHGTCREDDSDGSLRHQAVGP